ncbi:SMI1/KNR4 family protein [Kitasatospora griseola]|uniref:SMI1/KNR4 family protein n=1 Tax=Kitasatospora griseola TaxID=2064 RepID=UPI003855A2CC
MPDRLTEVLAVLGPGEHRFADAAAWAELEAGLGMALPKDFKAVVDAHAPIRINHHLYLHHPATDRWNLGKWIRETAQAWADVDFDEEEWEDPEEDPRTALGLSEVTFGTAGGLIPIAGTDRGEYVFLAPLPHDDSDDDSDGGDGDAPGLRICVVDQDVCWYEYRMSFTEWLHRYLAGEDMGGPNSSAFYPGPVDVQYLPMSRDDRPAARSGPAR